MFACDIAKVWIDGEESPEHRKICCKSLSLLSLGLVKNCGAYFVCELQTPPA